MIVNVFYIQWKNGTTVGQATPINTQLSFRQFVQDVSNNGLFFNENDWLPPGNIWRIWVDGTGKKIKVQ